MICCLQDYGEIRLICTCPGKKIGSDGAHTLAESLELNTTLTQLNLKSMSELDGFVFCKFIADFLLCPGNNIVSDGAQALAESLKLNITLTQLNLSCMSELGGFVVCKSMVRFS